MLSLITRINVTWVLCPSVFLTLAALGSPAYAGASFGQTVLEQPTIAAVGNEGEIRINFSTAIRYVRHAPERSGNALRISLQVLDPCAAEEIVSQESKWLPKADWYVPFTVTFPASIKRSSSGPSMCPTTHNVVYVDQSVLVKFDKEVQYKVRPGGDDHSIIITIPLIKQPEEATQLAKAPEPLAQPVVAVQPKSVNSTKPIDLVETQKQEPTKVVEPEMPAVDLLAAARSALASGDAVNATLLLNRLLNLPPNDYSKDAQELVGVAREKSGEVEKAKVEYKLYLSLYPTGESSERVKQRLAALEAVSEAPKKVAQKERPKRPVKEIHQNTVTGSVSQYYYTGKTQGSSVDSAGVQTGTRSTDQSTLISNFDITGRFRNNQYDTKIVLRDTQVHNSLAGRVDRNTLSAAYIEHQNKEDDYMFRIGRQSGTSQGVLGRFDGAFARYGLNPQWRITAVVGEPDNGSQNRIITKRHFYGAGIEFGPLAEKWSGTVYAIQQVADGLVERRAVGSELRYFNGTTSLFGMVDYDTVYDALNTAMFQANWTMLGGYNFNLLLDHRKSPILYGEIGTQIQSPDPLAPRVMSVGDLRKLLSSSDIYSAVKGLVPESDMAMVGVTKQINEKWQLGGDVRVSRIGSTDGFGIIAAQPGISNNWTYTIQAIGSNAIFHNDSLVIMASFVEDPVYNAQNVSFSHSLAINDKLRFDSAIRYYQEDRDTGQQTRQISPNLRMNYRWKDNLSFEAQLNIDRTHTDDPTSGISTTTWREFLFAGYRWDFR